MKKGLFHDDRYLFAILIAVSCFALFFDLGGRGFQNKDYLRFAETAREMMFTGDYVVPHYAGKIYLAKPPLLMWTIAISSYFTGEITPFTARIPSALCALTCIIVVYSFGKHLYQNPLAGFWAGLVLLSNYMFFLYSRTVKTDMMLTTFIFTALYGFYMGYTNGGQRKFFYFIVFYVSMALAILTKGPLGLILPVLIVFLYLLAKRDLSFFKRMHWPAGLGILVLIVTPWVFLMCQRIGLDTVVKNVMSESAVRYGTEEYGHKQPFYFFFPEIVKGFLPYSVFFPAIFVCLFSRRVERKHGDRLWLSVWCVTVFVFMSISQCKSARYILPLYPALALMLGGMWTSASNTETNNQYLKKWVARTLAVTLGFVLLLSAGFPVYTASRYQELLPASIGVGTVFFAGIVCRLCVKKWRSYNVSYSIIIAFFAILALIYMKEISLYNHRHSPGLDLANAVSRHVQKNELYAYKAQDECLSPMNFYLNRLIPEIENKQQISQIFSSAHDVYCIVGNNAYHETDFFRTLPHTRVRDIRYKDIDLMLISNSPNTIPLEW